MKKYTSGCAQCTWNGEFVTVTERRAADRAHNAATGHGVIGHGTVPDEFLPAPSLVEWLRAQLDEDERVARAAGSRLDGSHRWVAGDANADGVRTEAGTPVTRFSWPNEMEHIARHDPASVLREVAAKRAILEIHGRGHECSAGSWRAVWIGDERPTCVTLRHLASVYEDRPGYREEWKP